MLELRLLGPLEVRDGKEAIDIPRQKQRALLAVLALNAGQVLSKDRLVDALWGENAVAGAGHALENYVSQLRKLLGASVIVTRAPGYALDVEPEQVDALRFEGLVRDRQPEEALALVRGAPLEDVASEPFALNEIRRLEELELSAREQAIELRLDRGRHAEAVPELEQLVAAEPYRERLRALLMLALYRSGRQADALAAYQNARQALVDELGIDPGEELQELERAILRQDASLRAPEPVEQATPVARPARKTVTVLCALASDSPLDPEALVAARRQSETVMRAVVERHGGVVRGALALFGVPTLREDDALRAVRAAAELQSGRAVRIGIATGEVLVDGESVVGEPLLRAEELARAADPGDAELDERTRQLAEVRGLRLDSPLVGRTRQLAALEDAFSTAAAERRCQLVTLLGPAGIGKSRLIEELRSRVGDEAAVAVYDDLHASEPEILDEIEQLAGRSRNVPLLILCSARPELLDHRPSWGGGRVDSRTLLLEPLDPAESEQVMDNLLGESDLAPIVRRYIVDAAEGNPLFLEEFLGLLVDRAVLRREGGTWTTQELPSLAVPPTIQALLASRIDRLPDDERHVLELASIQGRTFDHATVAELAPEELRDQVSGLLGALVRRDVIVPERGGYAFRHQLLREAAYGSIPKATRADLHERLGHVEQARKLRTEIGVSDA